MDASTTAIVDAVDHWPKNGEMNLGDAAGLPFGLTAEGDPPLECHAEGSMLVLRGGASSDLFVDPAGGGPQLDGGRLLGDPPAGDFTLSARVSVDFSSRYDAGVVLLYVDAFHWAKLCFEYSPQSRPTVVSVVTRGSSDDCNSFEVEGNSVWLRIIRSGQAWAFHASTDGVWWRLVRYFALDGSTAPVRIGFEAQSPTGEGCTARFEDVTFTHEIPGDLRDGS